jgi:diadenosine tetraphosphate (Ap4A) HIT family hydrolase
MDDFKLDTRLQEDCYILSDTGDFIILLMNNSLVPWFILVPKIDKTELYQLDVEMQHKCFDQVNNISKFISNEYKPDKLNVAAIGNIVKQLHIHVVGRFEYDHYWPGVVWGNDQKKIYTQEQVDHVTEEYIELQTAIK